MVALAVTGGLDCGEMESQSQVFLLVLGRCMRVTFTLVDFAMASEIRNDGEVATTAFHIACKSCNFVSHCTTKR